MDSSNNTTAQQAHVSESTAHMLQQLKRFYSEFSVAGIARIEDIYTQDVEFRDPVHTLQGSLAMKAYLRHMAASLDHYEMRYLDELVNACSAYYTWELDFAHKAINGGRLVTVRGMSQFRFTSKVYYHEDCYDLGALVYEHVPLLGAATRLVKRRLGGKH